MMKIRKEWTHSTCPLCGAPEETTEHVLLCQAVSATKIWDNSMSKLDDWLTSQKTEPSLQRHILGHLRSWRKGQQHQRPTAHRYHLTQAVIIQNQIGWYNFLLGRTSHHFQQAQQAPSAFSLAT